MSNLSMDATSSAADTQCPACHRWYGAYQLHICNVGHQPGYQPVERPAGMGIPQQNLWQVAYEIGRLADAQLRLAAAVEQIAFQMKAKNESK